MFGPKGVDNNDELLQVKLMGQTMMMEKSALTMWKHWNTNHYDVHGDYDWCYHCNLYRPSNIHFMMVILNTGDGHDDSTLSYVDDDDFDVMFLHHLFV